MRETDTQPPEELPNQVMDNEGAPVLADPSDDESAPRPQPTPIKDEE